MAIQGDPEFQRLLELLNQRYEDFFVQERELEAWHRLRRSGAQEIERERIRYEREAEAARLQYIRERKAAPDMSTFEREYERQVKAREEAHKKERELYVRRREALQRTEARARKIPPEVELKLYVEED